MIKFLNKIFSSKNSEKVEDIAKPTELQISITSLLIRAASIDDDFAILEEKKIEELVKKYFNIDDDDMLNVLQEAKIRESNAVDLYSFTKIIKENLNQEERKIIIEMMWEIVAVDKNFDPYENNLVWRTAELIGISTRDRMNLKSKVIKNL
ncbi:TerB family tellurite resistance protein [Hyphomicrobiales bacterium]|jgi:uncharacterized tellurite resistance protein B-like protein|nr:TerB family tellurite resistance protein [Hyphomicrobiales bacterium]